MDSGISAEDRRASLAELKDLLASNLQAQLAVGHIGLHVLCSVLREDRDDVELVRGALEALLQAITRHADKTAQGIEPAAVNAELLSRDPRTLALLLSLLDEDDFYVRYHALQLLSSLMASNQHQVQSVVLAKPHGMLRLLDLVSDREAIRNEALVLLNSLTRGKEEIQKLLAFEGALERLFGIVADEGGSEGGVVVQDCLELVNNLLRACAPNQVLFRESGLAHKLPALLALRPAASSALSKQAAANVLCALEVALVLASPTGSDATAVALNQAALKKAGVLDAVLPLALGGNVRFSAVRTVARLCAAAIIARSSDAQEALAAAFVPTGEDGDLPEPALLVLLQAAVHSNDPIECGAAERLVSAYCDHNPTGQVLLVSTLAPIADSDSGNAASFGSRLSTALFDARPDVAAQAVSLLQHLLLDNSAAKEQLLRVPLDVPGSALPTLFMSCCTRMLSDAVRAADATSARLQVSLLRLLLVWLHDCPPATASLLASPAHLPLLVDCTMRGDVHVAGFSAAVLGCCMLSNHSSSDCNAQTVLDVIVSRVTLAQYFVKWEHMMNSDEFVAASSPPACARALVTRSSVASAFEGAAFYSGWRSGGALSDNTYSAPVAALLKRLEPAVRSGVLALYARPKQTAATNSAAWEAGGAETDQTHIVRLKSLLQAAETELAELRARNAALAQQVLLREREPAVDGGGAPPPTLAAAVDTSAQELLSRVRQDAERDLAAARAECEEARRASARNEESLKALSQAYNALEAAHFRLEEELRQASAGSADGGVTLERLRAAVAEARQAGITEGAEAAAAEHEQEMSDLLVCLGQEEAKVVRLCRELEARGVDTGPLLAQDDDDDAAC